MSLLSRQFIGGCYSGNSQQRLQKHRQTIVDCIRHLDVLITPTVETDNTSTLYSSAGGGNPAKAHSNNDETTTTGQCRAPLARVRICSPPCLPTFDNLHSEMIENKNKSTHFSFISRHQVSSSMESPWVRKGKQKLLLSYIFFFKHTRLMSDSLQCVFQTDTATKISLSTHTVVYKADSCWG